MKKPKNRKILSLITAALLAVSMTIPATFSVELPGDGEIFSEEIPTTETGDANSKSTDTGIEDEAVPNENLDEAGSVDTAEPEAADIPEGAKGEDTVSDDSVSDNSVSENEITEDDLLHRNFGYVPEEEGIYDFDHTENRNNGIEILRSAPSESYYVSLSDSTSGTPSLPAILLPEDQGASGLCWIYSTNKAMEFNLALKGKEYKNISEKNTGYYFWHKAGHGSEGDALYESYQTLTSWYNKVDPERGCYNLGGNNRFMKGYLQCWKGLVPQSGDNDFNGQHISEYDLYDDAAPELGTPDADAVYSDEIGHVNNITIISSTDSDGIKELVKDYGAVTIAVHTSACDVNNTYPAWYDPSTSSTNHMVTIIGWDDTYPKENCATRKGTPEHNGAWYCMNSWGQGAEKGMLDDNGCFWLSYEDGSFRENRTVSAYDVSTEGDADWEDHNYITTDGGNIFSGAPGTGTDIYGARYHDSYGVSYTVEGSESTQEEINAIGFETYKTNTSFAIKTYEGSDNTGILIDSQEVSFPRVGYHRVKLNTPFNVYKGNAFYVELLPTDRTYEVPVTSFREARKNGSNYLGTSTTTSKYNNDYFDIDCYDAEAYGVPFIDGKGTDNNGNALKAGPYIHVLTKNVYSASNTFKGDDVTATYGGANISPTKYYTFSPAQGSSEAITEITSDKPSVAKVNTDKTLTVGVVGTANVTVKTSEGRQVTSKITVVPRQITAGDINLDDGIGGYNYNTGQYETSVRKSGQYWDESTHSIRCPVHVKQINGQWLEEGVDYEVKCYNNTHPGMAKAVLTGKGNFCGSYTRYYKAIFNEPSIFEIPQSTVNVKTGDAVDIYDHVEFIAGDDYYGNLFTVSDIGIGDSYATENDIAKVDGSEIIFKKEGTVKICLCDSQGTKASLNFAVAKASESVEPGGNDDNSNPGDADGNNDDTDDNNDSGTNDNNTPSVPSGDKPGAGDNTPGGNNSGQNESDTPNEGGDNTPGESGDKGDNEEPGINPSNPVTPAAPETEAPAEDPNTQTLDIESGEFKVEVKLPKSVPFAKSKKVIANYVKFTLKFGTESGIYIKSVKATKPKNGVSKVTVKLKGSNKAEKKAVKAMNKRLKNIPVSIDTE